MIIAGWSFLSSVFGECLLVRAFLRAVSVVFGGDLPDVVGDEEELLPLLLRDLLF